MRGTPAPSDPGRDEDPRAAGLAVRLVNAAQARNLPGRPKTDP